MYIIIQLDLSGLGFAGPGMGVGSPGSPGKNSSAFGSTGFPGLQAGSHFSGQVGLISYYSL